MGNRYLDHQPHKQIYDSIRKKYVAYTPEEHVRQLILNYLLQVKNYPKGLISVEKAFWINGRQLRYDIVVFKPDLSPFLLVECKSPNIDLSPKNHKIIRQVLVYNLNMQAPYLLLGNGKTLIVFKKQHNNFTQIPDVPDWSNC